jgi:hypothetical protein
VPAEVGLGEVAGRQQMLPHRAIAGRPLGVVGQPRHALVEDAGVTVFGDDAIVVRGGFDANFNAFTNRVERVPLTLSGSGTQTVSVGTPRTLLQNSARCTRVTFALGAGNDLYLGLNDRQGRRLIKLAP